MFSDAQIYCISAVDSINNGRATNPFLKNLLDSQIAEVQQSEYYQSISFKQLVKVVCEQTIEAVENDGDTLEDPNSVAWHLGLLCYIHRNATPATNSKFDELFVECWEYLHSGMAEINALEILAEACNRLIKRNGSITVPMVEAEVINQACLWIFKNHQSEIISSPDVSRIDINKNLQFRGIAESFADAAMQLFENHYTEREKAVAITAVLQNISWSGMWDYLCKYYLTKHGIQLNNEQNGDGFIIFNSTRHERYQNGQIVSGSEVERVVELNFTNDKKRLFVSIEPTLSGKPSNLIGKNGNKFKYRGDDPDYEFTVYFDEFEEVEKFILHRTDKNLQLIYY